MKKEGIKCKKCGTILHEENKEKGLCWVCQALRKESNIVFINGKLYFIIK